DGRVFLRIPVRTHVIMSNEDMAEIAWRYCNDLVQPDDIIFMSEKATAASQGRAIPIDEIKPRPLAVYLAGKVKKVSYGIGLGSPETMEMAIRECGTPRILLGAAVHAITRMFGRTGDFYRVAGMQAALIDGAADYVIPPYNKYVTLGPKDPDAVAARVATRLGVRACVVDVNDVGGSWVIGSSAGVDRRLVERTLCDNPLGQSDEQTPIGIIRECRN
ncbi:MAG TPA: coenzyme F420-0:L-glutamate ligase, partial [Bacillota bacterium]|nr:coenzyme F420-0:L-glutamate ligase [Bacillota bacterium]